MSTTPRTDRKRTAVGLIGLGAAFAVIITGWPLMNGRVPAGFSTGFLVGATLAVVAFGFGLWRSIRRPMSASTADRALTGGGDERDHTVLTRSLAVTGITALPMTGVAAVALALGAATEMIMAILLWAELLITVLAFAVIDHHS